MSEVVTGAKLELRIGNVAIAYANNVEYKLDLLTETIQGIDEIEVDEYAEIGTRVTFSASMFRVAFQAAFSLGIQPKIDQFLRQPELVAYITFSNSFKRNNNAKQPILLRLNGLKLVGRSGVVNARGVWIETLNFVARRMSDEGE